MEFKISPIPRGDVRYPTALAAIHDPPETLWVQGQVAALSAPSVAIVGSRAASPYALEVARRLGADLARRHITVVSGMARGVDSAAHLGALDGGGSTVAVFGCGVDVIYPREHATLARRICERGALVSEFSQGMPPLSYHFPQRNRIISGLSLAVVVVEAAEGSGSLITADFALEQGRAVLAVPGNVLGGRNVGAHSLLRDGAKLVECADDILEELPAGIRDSAAFAQSFGEPRRSGHESDARRRGSAQNESRRADPASQDPVLRCMTLGETYDLDDLAHRSGMDRVRLLPRLVELELCGALRRVDGGRFVRFRGPC
jgi:DNA processing protein